MTKATDTFRKQPWCHNCAQAVANKWCQLYSNPQTILTDLSMAAGGKAEGGICGALFAAQKALPQYADELTDEFRERVGATTCAEIKRIAKTPCPACVDIADNLVDEFLKKQQSEI